MRILIVSQYYPPEPVPIPHDVAHELAKRGHSVRVLTGFPNYPSGRLYPGVKQRWRNQEADGPVTVRRAPLFVDHSQRPLARMTNYATFAISSALARRFARGADVVYVYATQMTAALGPWLWRLTGGAPYVLHVQDLWPDSILGSSMVEPGPAAKAIEVLISPWLRSVYRRAGAVIGIAPTMVQTLVSRGVRTESAEMVFNWAGESAPAAAALASSVNGTRLLYAGNVGDMQDLETVVQAVHGAADAGVSLRILGDGVALPRVKRAVAQLGATNVEFISPVPRDQMHLYYRDSDFALVTLKDLPAFRGTIPSKYQAVLAAGVPVITTVQGDVRRLTEDLGVGFTADAEDTASLEDALRRAAGTTATARTEMAERARTAYQSRFSRDAGIRRLEEILARTAKV